MFYLSEKQIKQNLIKVRERIENAAKRAGRALSDITLVGVTKTKPSDYIRYAYMAGLTDFGENYAQELVKKHKEIGSLNESLKWHFIGHLQSNKVKQIIPIVYMIHSVDSLSLIKKIEKEAEKTGKIANLLIEVNVAGEASKSGCTPEQLNELTEACIGSENINLCGLMTIPPFLPAEQVRPFFVKLREMLENTLQSYEELKPYFKHLSMGMSSDFEIAIEEGATMVRVGTDIFGPRQ